MFQKRNLAVFSKRKPLVPTNTEIPADSGSLDKGDSDLQVSVKQGKAKVDWKFSARKRLCIADTREIAATNSTKSFEAETYTFDHLEEIDSSSKRATASYEIDTDASVDHRSILERNVEIGKKILNKELEDKVYRGMGAYRPVVNVKEGSIAASKYTGLYGPIRASATNVRTTLRIDYQPDVCKDYKETGYCGFGDTCKFLHDRSDYKTGWQLENEWEQKQAEKRLKMQKKIDRWQRKMQNMLGCEDEPESDESEDSSHCDSESCDEDAVVIDSKEKKEIKRMAKEMQIPFCCLSCKKVWSEDMNPVVTSCGHYFCEKCAMASYSESMKCAKCSESQDGILNKATNVLKLLDSLKNNNNNKL